MNLHNPRLVVVGSVDFSNRLLKEILLAEGKVVGVVSKFSAGLNADYCDLSPTARLNSIRFTRLMT